MDRKVKNPVPPDTPRKSYRPPRLVVFGRLHALVQAGSAGNPEGMSGKTDKRG
jgi:hypothetical protein